MYIPLLVLPENSSQFPAPETADEDGILAIGSNLKVATLVKAYRLGAFPWYSENQPIIWHHPDPRFVLFPGNLHISHSMICQLKKETFTFRINSSFKEVMRHCRNINRKNQEGLGTWISDDIEKAYYQLYEAGFAQSAEAWQGNDLVGGLYGVKLGKVFFGESMFSTKSNASKFAFIKMVQHLKQQGIQLIDCQVHTSHLASLGAGYIPRQQFTDLLKDLIP